MSDEGASDPQTPWWIAQLNMLVKTVGVSGVILGLMLWGAYNVALRMIDMVRPHVESVTAEHIRFMRRLDAQNEQQTEVMTEIARSIEQVGKSNNEAIGKVHDRLDGIEHELGVKAKPKGGADHGS